MHWRMLRIFLTGILIGCAGEVRQEPEELRDLDRTVDPACDDTWVAAAVGRVVDEQGNGLGDSKAQLCVHTEERFVCLGPPESKPDGSFVRIVEEMDLRCMTELGIRSLVPNGPFATTYCDVPLRSENGVLYIDEPIVLYETQAGELPPAGDENSIRDVRFADGLVLEVAPSQLGSAYDQLRATRVDPADRPCFAQGHEGLRALYGFQPERAVGGGGFRVRMPNHDNLPEGTEVELLILGGLETLLADGRQVDVAELEAYGRGTVVDNEVVSNDGSELPYLSWVGYR